MDLKAQRAAALKAAQDIIAKAKAEDRGMTDEERAEVEAKTAEINDLDAKIAKAKESNDLLAKVSGLGTVEDDVDDPTVGAKSLGDHFVKSVGPKGLERVKTVSGATVSAPEFKASSDTQKVPSGIADFLTQFDQTVVQGFRRPTVSDLFGTGTLSGASIAYLVEGSFEGTITTVAEGGAKPQVHVADPSVVTDALKKIAAFLKFTDEMMEDAPFLVSEINNLGLYKLALAEENQLLNGAGTGSTITGLLNRSGVQTESAADNTDNADAVFRALTKVQTATGLSADAIVINPADYQSLRLGKDSNGQYFGGGYFAGEYGNGGVVQQPPLWGLRTVVSSAVTAKTAIVGAFGVGGTVYRKGGVRVESTNSHDTDFTSNLITVRIEERLALAVRVPKAFVNVTLSDTAPS
jgi:HK97 family phage major capsid protein